MSTPGFNISPSATPASRRYQTSTSYTTQPSRRHRRRLLVLIGLLTLVVFFTVIIVPPSVVLTRKNSENAEQQKQLYTTVVGGVTSIFTRGGVATRSQLTTLPNGEVSTITSRVALPVVTVSATSAESVQPLYVTTTLNNGAVVVLETATSVQTKVATVTYTATNGAVGVQTITLTSLELITVLACVSLLLPPSAASLSRPLQTNHICDLVAPDFHAFILALHFKRPVLQFGGIHSAYVQIVLYVPHDHAQPIEQHLVALSVVDLRTIQHRVVNLGIAELHSAGHRIAVCHHPTELVSLFDAANEHQQLCNVDSLAQSYVDPSSNQHVYNNEQQHSFWQREQLEPRHDLVLFVAHFPERYLDKQDFKPYQHHSVCNPGPEFFERVQLDQEVIVELRLLLCYEFVQRELDVHAVVSIEHVVEHNVKAADEQHEQVGLVPVKQRNGNGRVDGSAQLTNVRGHNFEQDSDNIVSLSVLVVADNDDK
ncbi:hypothetical protein JCM3770_003411 [Rhodotorula araucariae]